MSIEIVPLTAAHAPMAATLHAQGQVGTFLTSLGPAFLRALYQAIPASPYGFGYAACDAQGTMVGVIAGATQTNALFKDLILRQWWRLAPPVAGSLLRRPTLIPNIVRSLLYPSAEVHPGAGELLFIGVQPGLRSQGIGARLYAALREESRARQVQILTVLVDARNEGANRFYRRHGFHYDAEQMLFGRQMYFYHQRLDAQN